MTDKNRTQILLDATEGIREEYIEEAAACRRSRPAWVAVAAAAAVLALVMGLAAWLRDTEPSAGQIPFFAIRAYAQDGSLATLESAGDSSNLAAGESDRFPGKQTYTLEIYLTNEDRSRVDLSDYQFRCFHKGRYLEPGDSDDLLSITLLEENGIYGYRIIGWCEDYDLLDISVRDKDGMILYQKSMRIDYNWQYSTKVFTSYNYDEGLTTEELIAKILDSGQDYSRTELLSSSIVPSYSAYANQYGGFRELEKREDAASLLLQRWLKEMEVKKDMLQYYVSVDNTGLLGNMLAQDVYWDQLSEAERQQIEQVGLRRWFSEPFSFFPGKKVFQYDIVVDGAHTDYDRLDIDWSGRTDETQREHIITLITMSAAGVQDPYHGWEIIGWFDEPTRMTLTVTNQDGVVIRRDVILITPTEDGYQIDVIDE